MYAHPLAYSGGWDFLKSPSDEIEVPSLDSSLAAPLPVLARPGRAKACNAVWGLFQLLLMWNETTFV